MKLDNPIMSHLAFIAPIYALKKNLTALQSKATLVGHLSIDGDFDCRRETVQDLCMFTEKLGTAISKYGHWAESRFTLADSPDEATKTAQDAIDAVNYIMEPITREPPSDPRAYMYIDGLNKVINGLMSIWVTLDVPNPDGFIRMFLFTSYHILFRLVNIINSLSVAFGIEPIDKLIFQGNEIWRMGDNKNPLNINYHNDVVSLTQAEKEAIARAEAQKQEELQRQKELAEKKASVVGFAETILKCYNRHMQVGNLTSITLTDDAIRCLEDPSSDEDISKIESLYTLLLAMSNSVRYMPGEEGTASDRVMGSFMELDKDIASYKQPFTIYLNEFGLKHNDIVIALPMIKAKGGHIVAQYVDSKQYIDKLDSSDKGPKLIHLLFTP